MYFNMPFIYTIDDAGVNVVVIKKSGIENMSVTVMLTQLADST
jgi:hypothetical protein